MSSAPAWPASPVPSASPGGGRRSPCTSRGPGRRPLPVLFDAGLDRIIDNGNHLLLSANTAALDYLEEIGASDTVSGLDHAEFPFMDLRDGRRWTVRPNAGPLPWWIFQASRRIPGTKPWDYLSALSILKAGDGDTVAGRIDCRGPLYEGFWRPLTVAASTPRPRRPRPGSWAP